MKTKKEQVGGVIGRFQTPYLHEGHIELLNIVCDDHEKVIIFLGLSPLRGSKKNPLDYQAREQMIREKFPHVIIQYIKDVMDDEVWSKNLDSQISDLIGPSQKIRLYGSRDSFIKGYKGKFPVTELVPTRIISATEIREKAYVKAKNSEDFRIGVIHQSGNKYPTVYTTVDIAIFNDDETKILMAKKPNEKKYRFVGGFSSPESPSFEADARREVAEETHLEITDPIYIGSYLIPDWRYEHEEDKIKTLFFKSKRAFGKEEPDDDICELRWFEFGKIQNSDIVYNHRILLEALKNNMNK